MCFIILVLKCHLPKKSWHKFFDSEEFLVKIELAKVNWCEVPQTGLYMICQKYPPPFHSSLPLIFWIGRRYTNTTFGGGKAENSAENFLLCLTVLIFSNVVASHTVTTQWGFLFLIHVGLSELRERQRQKQRKRALESESSRKQKHHNRKEKEKNQGECMPKSVLHDFITTEGLKGWSYTHTPTDTPALLTSVTVEVATVFLKSWYLSTTACLVECCR